MPLSNPISYPDIFKKRLFWSQELLNPDLLYNLMTVHGYQYIRRYEKQHFRDIVRNPTVGCMVEVSVAQQVGSIPLTSPKALRLIKKLCYF